MVDSYAAMRYRGRKIFFTGKIYLTGKVYQAELDSRLDQFPSMGAIATAFGAAGGSPWRTLIVASN
jgi:hypothetical protein